MMLSRFRLTAIAGLLVAALLTTVLTASARAAGPIKKPKFDPDARQVDLFDGIKEGLLDVKMIPKDSKHGNILFKNVSKEPLTVQVPDSIVGVHVLKQFDDFAGGAFGGGALGGDTGGGGGGGAQALGGGLGGGGFGGGLGGAGGGLFSIPPEKTVSLPFASVCLEHGLPEPSPRMDYRVIPTDQAIEDPALRQLLKLVATGRIHPQVAQAAAWHLANDMTWRELASKRVDRLGGLPSTPYFNLGQLQAAQQLVAIAEAKAREEQAEQPDEAETSHSRLRLKLRSKR